MKFHLAHGFHGFHLPRRLHIGGHGRGVENILRTAQLILVIWLAVYGGKLLASGLIAGAKAVFGLFS